MASPTRTKEIQVQRPAQSLQAFQKGLEKDRGAGLDFVKPVLIGAGVILVGALAFFGYQSWMARSVEKHEAAIAALVLSIQGDPAAPPQPAEIEKRMRASLPRLEQLAKSAPASQKGTTEGMLASWRLALDGKGGIAPSTKDPWSRLNLAQRQIALGQGQEALGTLTPLRDGAEPGAPWADLYWKTLLDVRCLRGEREQALQDYAEYKRRFRDRADIRGMETLLTRI